MGGGLGVVKNECTFTPVPVSRNVSNSISLNLKFGIVMCIVHYILCGQHSNYALWTPRTDLGVYLHTFYEHLCYWPIREVFW